MNIRNNKDKKPKYGMRKLSVGLVSCILGFSILIQPVDVFLNTNIVHAENMTGGGIDREKLPWGTPPSSINDKNIKIPEGTTFFGGDDSDDGGGDDQSYSTISIPDPSQAYNPWNLTKTEKEAIRNSLIDNNAGKFTTTAADNNQITKDNFYDYFDIVSSGADVGKIIYKDGKEAEVSDETKAAITKFNNDLQPAGEKTQAGQASGQKSTDIDFKGIENFQNSPQIMSETQFPNKDGQVEPINLPHIDGLTAQAERDEFLAWLGGTKPTDTSHIAVYKKAFIESGYYAKMISSLVSQSDVNAPLKYLYRNGNTVEYSQANQDEKPTLEAITADKYYTSEDDINNNLLKVYIVGIDPDGNRLSGDEGKYFYELTPDFSMLGMGGLEDDQKEKLIKVLSDSDIYNPTGGTLTVTQGDGVTIDQLKEKVSFTKDGQSATNTADFVTSINFAQDQKNPISTENPGEQDVKLTVTYKDGSSENVIVKVNVEADQYLLKVPAVQTVQNPWDLLESEKEEAIEAIKTANNKINWDDYTISIANDGQVAINPKNGAHELNLKKINAVSAKDNAWTGAGALANMPLRSYLTPKLLPADDTIISPTEDPERPGPIYVDMNGMTKEEYINWLNENPQQAPPAIKFALRNTAVQKLKKAGFNLKMQHYSTEFPNGVDQGDNSSTFLDLLGLPNLQYNLGYLTPTGTYPKPGWDSPDGTITSPEYTGGAGPSLSIEFPADVKIEDISKKPKMDNEKYPPAISTAHYSVNDNNKDDIIKNSVSVPDGKLKSIDLLQPAPDKAGNGKVAVKITYDDGSVENVDIPVVVTTEPVVQNPAPTVSAGKLTVFRSDANSEDTINKILDKVEGVPDTAKKSVVKLVNGEYVDATKEDLPNTLGEHSIPVKVTFADGNSKIVLVPEDIVEKDSLLYPPTSSSVSVESKNARTDNTRNEILDNVKVNDLPQGENVTKKLVKPDPNHPGQYIDGAVSDLPNTVGKYLVPVEVTYPDNSTKVVEVPFIVEETPKDSITYRASVEGPVSVNRDILSTEEGITNTKNEILGKVTTTAPADKVKSKEIVTKDLSKEGEYLPSSTIPTVVGTHDIYVKVTYSDGSSDVVEVPLNVTENDAQKDSNNKVYTSYPDTATDKARINNVLNALTKDSPNIDIEKTKVNIDDNNLPKLYENGILKKVTINVVYVDGSTKEKTVYITVTQTQNKTYPPYVTGDVSVIQANANTQDTRNKILSKVQLPSSTPLDIKNGITKIIAIPNPKTDPNNKKKFVDDLPTAQGEHEIPVKVYYPDGSSETVNVKLNITAAETDAQKYPPMVKGSVTKELSYAKDTTHDTDIKNEILSKVEIKATGVQTGLKIKDGYNLPNTVGIHQVPVVVTYPDNTTDTVNVEYIITDNDANEDKNESVATEYLSNASEDTKVQDVIDALMENTPKINKENTIANIKKLTLPSDPTNAPQEVTVTVVYKDGSTKDKKVNITVLKTQAQKDEIKDLSVKYPEGTSLDTAESFIKNVVTTKTSGVIITKVEIVNPDTVPLKAVNNDKVAVKITYSDGSTKVVEVSVTVTPKSSDKNNHDKPKSETSKDKSPKYSGSSSVNKETKRTSDYPKYLGGRIKLVPVGKNSDNKLIYKRASYIEGYPGGNVMANRELTRAEIAMMISRINGFNMGVKMLPNFKDTRNNAWYNGAINAVVGNGIMNGYPDETFRPNDKITRAELAKILSNVYKKDIKTGSFADVSGHWAEDAINSAFSSGFVNGYPDGTFKPDEFVTRAEAAKMLNKLYIYELTNDNLTKVEESKNFKKFNDNNKKDWYYQDIVEASNGYYFTLNGEGNVISIEVSNGKVEKVSDYIISDINVIDVNQNDISSLNK